MDDSALREHEAAPAPAVAPRRSPQVRDVIEIGFVIGTLVTMFGAFTYNRSVAVLGLFGISGATLVIALASFLPRVLHYLRDVQDYRRDRLGR